MSDILPDVKDELLFDLKNWLISVDADMPLTPEYEGHAFKKNDIHFDYIEIIYKNRVD